MGLAKTQEPLLPHPPFPLSMCVCTVLLSLILIVACDQAAVQLNFRQFPDTDRCNSTVVIYTEKTCVSRSSHSHVVTPLSRRKHAKHPLLFNRPARFALITYTAQRPDRLKTGSIRSSLRCLPFLYPFLHPFPRTVLYLPQVDSRSASSTAVCLILVWDSRQEREK